MNTVFYQDDNDRNYYCMDFSTHQSMASGDTITGLPIVTSEIRGGFTSDLNITDISASGHYVCMWVSGGTALRTYKIEVLANTLNGLTLEGDGYITIGD